MGHRCHAHGCEEEVAPRLLFCRPHWYELPRILRDAIWAEYRRGQERDKRPSLRYLAVQRVAVAHSALAAGDEAAAERYLDQAVAFGRKAVDAGHGDPVEGLLRSLEA